MFILNRHKILPYIAVITTLCCLQQSASATQIRSQRVFGAGGVIGEPTGGTLKLFVNDRFAFQTALAFSFWGSDHLASFTDFIWYPSRVTQNRHFLLTWYFGVGFGFGLHAPWTQSHNDDWNADPTLWFRMPFGFSFLFNKIPLEAFIEFGPSNRVYPSWRFYPFIALGARWYF